MKSIWFFFACCKNERIGKEMSARRGDWWAATTAALRNSLFEKWPMCTSIGIWVSSELVWLASMCSPGWRRVLDPDKYWIRTFVHQLMLTIVWTFFHLAVNFANETNQFLRLFAAPKNTMFYWNKWQYIASPRMREHHTQRDRLTVEQTDIKTSHTPMYK